MPSRSIVSSSRARARAASQRAARTALVSQTHLAHQLLGLGAEEEGAQEGGDEVHAQEEEHEEAEVAQAVADGLGDEAPAGVDCAHDEIADAIPIEVSASAQATPQLCIVELTMDPDRGLRGDSKQRRAATIDVCCAGCVVPEIVTWCADDQLGHSVAAEVSKCQRASEA